MWWTLSDSRRSYGDWASQLCQILNGLPAKAAFVYEYKEGSGLVADSDGDRD